METEIWLLAISIVLSGVFSSAEVAFIAMTQAKVESLAKKSKSGRAIKNLKKDSQTLLITILIGNNLVNIGATALSTAISLNTFKNLSLGVVTGIMTFIILLFGEIIPKTFAQKYAVQIATFFVYPLTFLKWIFYPLTICFEFLINVLMRFGKKHKMESVTEEELLAMVKIGKKEGTIEEHEQTFISNILEFRDTQASEVMTPRLKLKTLEGQTTIDEAMDFFMKEHYTRIPVYTEKLENIIGVLTLKNAVKLHKNASKDTPITQAELMEPLFVPESKAIKALFNEFQKSRNHMAVVVDELGGVEGIVTLEDIIEEIVGEIEDEVDVRETLIKKVSNNTWMVAGETPLELIEEQLDIDLELQEEDIPVHKPVSFAILETLERFPKVGEKVDISQITLIVEKMGKRRIEMVKLVLNEKKKPLEE